MAKSGINIDDIDLKNLNKTLDSLKKFSSQELSNELGATALLAVSDMVDDVPVAKVFGGTLKQSIRSERTSPNEVALVADTEYAAYVEFGTGKYVEVDDLVKLGVDANWAYQNFKGKGIREVNIHPQPYFFKNIRKNLLLMMKRIDNKLDNLMK
jgi:hypothetical protein